MNTSLGFKPFNKFWINCIFNKHVSLLSSIEPSYNYIAYLNAYTYKLLNDCTLNKNLLIHLISEPEQEYMKKYYTSHINYIHYNFINKINCLEEIKELLFQNVLIDIGVDLFYWIPASVCWQKHHWEHYSFINGYNSKDKIFFVFDENLSEYNSYGIPESRLIKAVDSSPLNPHAILLEIKKDIIPVKLSLNDVMIHANRIINEINNLDLSKIWKLNEKDMIEDENMLDLMAMHAFQIKNRHKGNMYLFNSLYELKILNNRKYILSLVDRSHFLQKGWEIVKNKILKTSITRKQSYLDEAFNKCYKLLDFEKKTWEDLLKNN